MVALLLASTQSLSTDLLLEKIREQRAVQVTVNGEQQIAVVEPMDPAFGVSQSFYDQHGEKFKIEIGGVEAEVVIRKDMISSDLPVRTVTGKNAELYLGSHFFQAFAIGVDYRNESIRLFEKDDIEKYSKWIRESSLSGSVVSTELSKDPGSNWVTSDFSIDGKKYTVQTRLLTFENWIEGVSPFSTYHDLGTASARGLVPKGSLWHIGFWKDIKFLNNPINHFSGVRLSRQNNAIPDAGADTSSISLGEIGSRRVVWVPQKQQLWFSSPTTTECAEVFLAKEILQFPCWIRNDLLFAGRIPVFDKTTFPFANIVSEKAIQMIGNRTAKEVNNAFYGGNASGLAMYLKMEGDRDMITGRLNLTVMSGSEKVVVSIER